MVRKERDRCGCSEGEGTAGRALQERDTSADRRGRCWGRGWTHGSEQVVDTLEWLRGREGRGHRLVSRLPGSRAQGGLRWKENTPGVQVGSSGIVVGGRGTRR